MAPVGAGRGRLLVALVVLQIPLMYAIYAGALAAWGPRAAFLIGYAFYWSLWCYGLPIALLGRETVRGLFTDASRRPTALELALVVLPVLAAVAGRLVPEWHRLDAASLLASAAFALVNGVGEELLWRGAFLRVFPVSRVLGVAVPAVLFTLSHVAPTLLLGGAPAVLGAVLFIGVANGVVARRLGDLRVVLIAHVLVDLAGLLGLTMLGR